MIEPKLSRDGNCPACSCRGWKSAKMVVRSGTTFINTESSGYRGFETRGTHRTRIARDCRGPTKPDEYYKKNDWLERCKAALETAAKTKEEIDMFAYDRTAVTPGFFRKSIWEANLTPGFLFKSDVQALGKLYVYECELERWKKTRVCSRCGECFITRSDHAAVKPSFDIPSFQFPKQDERCPDCHSYHWKASDAYFEARLHVELIVLERQKQKLKQAQDYESKENPRFFERFLRKTAIISTVEEADKALAAQIGKIDSLKMAWQTAVDAFPNYPEARVCTKCEKMYCITKGD